jgi:hypothetical protein
MKKVPGKGDFFQTVNSSEQLRNDSPQFYKNP